MKLIEIPDDIDALDLAIQEKTSLALMRKRLCIPNGTLAKELGLSDSGARTMIRRFKQQGLIREFNIEGERQFVVMVDEQGVRQVGRQKLTKNDAVEMRHKVTAEPPAGLTPQEQAQWKAATINGERTVQSQKVYGARANLVLARPTHVTKSLKSLFRRGQRSPTT